MANFDLASHTLAFTDNYAAITVFGKENEPVAKYALAQTGFSLQIFIEDDDFVIRQQTDFDDWTCKIALDQTIHLAFENTRMGGIGIVDICDMKSGPAQKREIYFLLECCPLKMKKEAQPSALWLHCAGDTCMMHRTLNSKS